MALTLWEMRIFDDRQSVFSAKFVRNRAKFAPRSVGYLPLIMLGFKGLARVEIHIVYYHMIMDNLFILPDGGTIQISYLNDKPEQRVCRYIDPYRVEIGNNLYHICEFAERMEGIGATYKPVENG